MARTAGVPVDRFKGYAFGLSGLTAGLSAILLVARLGSASPSLGSDLLLDTMAAIVVGGTSLAGGVGGPQRRLVYVRGRIQSFVVTRWLSGRAPALMA